MAPRDSAATRARILGAAIDEFSAYGLAGGRIDRIAEAARANKRSIYVYYGQKEGLFNAGLHRVIGDALARLDVADRQRDLGPRPGQGPGRLDADSRCGTRDDRPASCEVDAGGDLGGGRGHAERGGDGPHATKLSAGNQLVGEAMSVSVRPVGERAFDELTLRYSALSRYQ